MVAEPGFEPGSAYDPPKPYNTFVPYANREDQRAASRRHYESNREAMIARAATRNRAERGKISKLIRESKDKPCADCKKNYPYYVMQFDHVREEKLFNIGGYHNQSYKTVEAEIRKCDVVCANCHAERTHQRKVAEVRFELTTFGL